MACFGVVKEFHDHGLRCLVLGNAGAIQPSLRKSATATAPYVKVVRALKKL
jgi:phthiodiolone/phenolphthiodiolone dimycocerosates ketoreductase